MTHLKKYFYVYIFIIIAIFNSFIQIGIIEDGSHHLIEALLADNPISGHEGGTTFPFNSRMFPTYLPHIFVGYAAFLEITNINVLVSLFTFIVYFSPIIFLLFAFFNIPNEKKENFEIILLSFLICFLFMEYHVWTENINTGLFLWILFVIYYYVDFKNMSKLNSVSLLLFSFIIISSHPMVVVFVLPFIFFGLKKFINTYNMDIKKKFVIITSFCLLFCAFVFNLYYLFYPIALPDDYFKFENFINKQFLVFLFSVFVILAVAIFNEKKPLKILFYAFICVLFYNLIFKVDGSFGYSYRTLGFYVPLFFMLFIVFKDRLNLKLNYKFLKITNIVLVTIILFNSINTGIVWNKSLNNIKKRTDNVSFIDFSEYLSMLPKIHHKASMISIYLIVTHKNNCDLKIDFQQYKSIEYNMVPSTINRLKENKNKLSKFNINTDKIVIENKN